MKYDINSKILVKLIFFFFNLTLVSINCNFYIELVYKKIIYFLVMRQ